MKISILLLATIFLFSCEPITMNNVVYTPPDSENPGGNNPGGNNSGGGNNPGGNNPPGINNPGGSNPPSINYPGYFENNFDHVFNVHERDNTPSSLYIRTPDLLRISVLEVIDGDTLMVRINNPPEGFSRTEIVRLKGIRAPKVGEWIGPEPCEPCRRGGHDYCFNIHGISCFWLISEQRRNWNRIANQAIDAINAAIGQFGNIFFLAFDQTARNRYGHLLAYVFINCGVSLNAYLLKTGLAKVQSPPNFSFRSEFRNHENFARGLRLGAWERSGITNPFLQKWP